MEKKERVLLSASIFLVVANSAIAGLGAFGARTSPQMFIAALILTILTFKFYIKDKIAGELPKYISIPLIIMGISYGLWGIVYFVPTYILCGYAFLLQLPVFYVCIKRECIKTLMSCYSRSYVIVTAVTLIACMLVAPLTGGQYSGLFNNPNLLGHFISSALICTIYIYETGQSRKIRILMLAVFGLLLAFTLFSRSRTTLLAFGCVAIVYLVYILVTKAGLLKRLGAFIAAAVIMVSLSYGMFSVVTPAVCELTGIEIDMAKISLQDELASAQARYLKGIGDEGSFFSGRTQIWKDFLSDTGFTGHKVDAMSVEYSGGAFLVNSHNTFIQVAYQSGLLSGIAFITIFVAIGIYILRRIVKKEFGVEDLFAAGCVANAVPYLMLANVLGPYASFSMMPFWFIVIPYYFVKSKEKGDKKCNSEI